MIYGLTLAQIEILREWYIELHGPMKLDQLALIGPSYREVAELRLFAIRWGLV